MKKIICKYCKKEFNSKINRVVCDECKEYIKYIQFFKRYGFNYLSKKYDGMSLKERYKIFCDWLYEKIKDKNSLEIFNFLKLRNENNLYNFLKNFNLHNKIKYICPVCNKEHDGKLSSGKFCSIACRERYISSFRSNKRVSNTMLNFFNIVEKIIDTFKKYKDKEENVELTSNVKLTIIDYVLYKQLKGGELK